MVAVVQMDEPIKGICNNSQVYSILPFPGNGQEKAKAPFTKEELTTKLNAEVTYYKDSTNYTDKGMVGIYVNCEGKMVQCKIDNKTRHSELDEQIVKVFSQMKTWVAGSIHGKPVDTIVLYSFDIVNGIIYSYNDAFIKNNN